MKTSGMPRFRHFKHADIDLARWDERLRSAHAPLPYAESYYLNALAPGWNALISDDYQWFMPLPWNRKLLGMAQVYQPFFVQQLGLWGPEPASQALVNHCLQAIPKSYLRILTCLNAGNESPNLRGFQSLEKTNFVLPLNSDYATINAGYSKSLRKRIRQASDRHQLLANPLTPGELIRWYRLHQGSKVAVPGHSYAALQRAMEAALQQGRAALWGALDQADGELRVAGFFLQNEHRIINLFGSSDSAGRDSFAMHYLLDQVIQAHAGKNLLFDFEGSSIPGIAAFFSSFGAHNQPYTLVQSTRKRLF